jgi:hypothetical protein
MFDVKDTGPIVAAIFKDPEGTNGKFIAAGGYHGTPQEIAEIFSSATGAESLFQLLTAQEKRLNSIKSLGSNLRSLVSPVPKN